MTGICFGVIIPDGKMDGVRLAREGQQRDLELVVHCTILTTLCFKFSALGV